MRVWAVYLEDSIVAMDSHDGISTPAIFLDERSALGAKAAYFPNAEYRLIEKEMDLREPNGSGGT